MNRQEFDEMRDEFAIIIYNYEKFLKDCILLDYRYNTQYFDILQKIRFYEVENGLMARCFQAREENADADVSNIIDNFQKGYKQEVNNALKKHKIATVVTKHSLELSEEDSKAFEELYQKFIHDHHPVVKALINDEEKNAYERLKVYYYENNFEGFKEAYELNKEVFLEPEYTEEIFSQISSYYYDIRKRIGQDFTKKQKAYPFTKKDVFVDDMSIAYEEAELKTALSKAIRDNHQFHEEFQKRFGFDVSVSNPEA